MDALKKYLERTGGTTGEQTVIQSLARLDELIAQEQVAEETLAAIRREIEVERAHYRQITSGNPVAGAASPPPAPKPANGALRWDGRGSKTEAILKFQRENPDATTYDIALYMEGCGDPSAIKRVGALLRYGRKQEDNL